MALGNIVRSAGGHMIYDSTGHMVYADVIASLWASGLWRRWGHFYGTSTRLCTKEESYVRTWPLFEAAGWAGLSTGVFRGQAEWRTYYAGSGRYAWVGDILASSALFDVTSYAGAEVSRILVSCIGFADAGTPSGPPMVSFSTDDVDTPDADIAWISEGSSATITGGGALTLTLSEPLVLDNNLWMKVWYPRSWEFPDVADYNSFQLEISGIKILL